MKTDNLLKMIESMQELYKHLKKEGDKKGLEILHKAKTSLNQALEDLK